MVAMIVAGVGLASVGLTGVGWSRAPERRPGVSGDRSVPLGTSDDQVAPLSDHDPEVANAPEAPSPQRGVALGLFAEDVSFSYQSLLEEIAALGAKDVALVVPMFQGDGRSDNLHWHTRRSPTLAQVAETIRQARRLRLGVTVFPVVQLEHPASGEWRGNLSPSHRTAWFRRYTDLLGDLAALAAATHADRLVVGSQLSTLDGPRDRAAWEALLLRVRGLFGGRLMYSASADHYREAALLDWVDETGVAATFSLRSPDQAVTEEGLATSWRQIRADLEAWSRERGKPFVFTEVLYRSRAGCTANPQDQTQGGSPAPEEQRQAFAAFRKAWQDAPALAGFYLWNWYGYGGATSTSDTPRGKPAEAEIRALLNTP